jgi:hypothetical protein
MSLHSSAHAPTHAEYLTGWKVKTSPVPIKPPYFTRVKSNNYLPNVLNVMDAEAEGFHQVRGIRVACLWAHACARMPDCSLPWLGHRHSVRSMGAALSQRGSATLKVYLYHSFF